MDDYDFSVNWATGEPITIAGLPESLGAIYQAWSGRMIAHGIAQLFLCMNEVWFDAANTLTYLLLLLMMYTLAKPKGKRFLWWIWVAAHAALFWLVPFFGTVFLWLEGSCNYLWCMVVALVPLCVQKSMAEGGFFSRFGWMSIPVCFLAGWTYENTACGVFALIAALLVIQRWQKGNVGFWQIAALIAEGVGIAMLLLAPGNFVRLDTYENVRPFILELLVRFAKATAYGSVYAGPFLLILIFVTALERVCAIKRQGVFTAILLFGALAGAYSMVASPVYSDRSWLCVLVFLLIAILSAVGRLEAHARDLHAAGIVALPLILVVFAYGGYKALGDVQSNADAWNKQLARVEEAVRRGEETVVLQSIPSTSRFTFATTLAATPEEWPNSTLSRALGIQIFAE